MQNYPIKGLVFRRTMPIVQDKSKEQLECNLLISDNMAKEIPSEVISKKYFQNLGFTIRERDFDGLKKGCDFFIEFDGCIQSVEAKAKMGTWVQMLRPQVERLKNGGLLAIVDNGNVHIETMDDVEKIEEVIVYKVSIKR